jgi:hypothetical protein
MPNGPGAAAVLSAGIGSLAVPIFAIAADKSSSVKDFFVIYKPTGALSGETTVAVLLWLTVWVILNWRWRNRSVSLTRINVIALALLGLGVLLTFPPLSDLF